MRKLFVLAKWGCTANHNMDSASKAIRGKIMKMPPKEAIQFVKSFELPEDEELFIIEHDIRKKSIVFLSTQNAVSIETVCRRRRDGYLKMAAGELNNMTFS